MKKLNANEKQKAMGTITKIERNGDEFLKLVREIQLKAEKKGLTASKLNRILYGKSQ